MRLIPLLSLLLASAPPAAATELIFGVGRSAYMSPAATDSAVLSLELRGNPLGPLGSGEVAPFVVAERHAAGDSFVGVGLAARWDLDERWFIDTGVAPGQYRAGRPGNDLGGRLEFRLHLAAGQHLGQGRAWSVAFIHKSNAGTGRINPGMNGVLLRLHQAF